MKLLFLFFIVLFFHHPLWAQFNIEGFKALKHSKFNTDFREYDQSTAVYLAHLSNLVYESEDNIQQCHEVVQLINPEAQYQFKFVAHEASSSEVLIYGSKDFVILAFKGTQEKEDYYTNGKFFGYSSQIDSLAPLPEYHLEGLPSGHAGFRRAIIDLVGKENLLERLDLFIAQYGKTRAEMPIYTTGHSLGAALSSMFLPVLIKEGYLFKGAYHFAPPLAIWKTEAIELKEIPIVQNCVYDIVNNTDYISRVPSYGRKNLMHIGKFYRIYKNDEDEPLLYREVERYIKYTFFEKLRPFSALYGKYHLLKHYIEGVSFSKNGLAAVVKRSKALDGCSSMKRNCSQQQKRYIQ